MTEGNVGGDDAINIEYGLLGFCIDESGRRGSAAARPKLTLDDPSKQSGRNSPYRLERVLRRSFAVVFLLAVVKGGTAIRIGSKSTAGSLRRVAVEESGDRVANLPTSPSHHRSRFQSTAFVSVHRLSFSHWSQLSKMAKDKGIG